MKSSGPLTPSLPVCPRWFQDDFEVVLLVRGRWEVQPELTFPSGNPNTGSPKFVSTAAVSYTACCTAEKPLCY